MVYGDKERKTTILSGYEWKLRFGCIILDEYYPENFTFPQNFCVEIKNLYINDVKQNNLLNGGKLTHYAIESVSIGCLISEDCIDILDFTTPDKVFTLKFDLWFYMDVDKFNSYGNDQQIYYHMKVGIDTQPQYAGNHVENIESSPSFNGYHITTDRITVNPELYCQDNANDGNDEIYISLVIAGDLDYQPYHNYHWWWT